MGQVSEYLLTIPPSGPYEVWLYVMAGGALMIALVARQVASRTGSVAVRRQGRRLAGITSQLAVLIGLSLAARALALPVASWRLWLVLGGMMLLGRLGWWLLGLRSLPHDRVDERTRNRKELYFSPRRKRPAKRRRRPRRR